MNINSIKHCSKSKITFSGSHENLISEPENAPVDSTKQQQIVCQIDSGQPENLISEPENVTSVAPNTNKS